MAITTGKMGAFATAQPPSNWLHAAGSASSALSSVIQGDTSMRLAEADAKTQREAAMSHAAKLRRATRRTVGSARAATAASGVALDEFSTIATNDIEQRGAQDESVAVLDGERAAIDTLLRGGMARNAAYGNAAGSLLKGAAYTGWKGTKKTDEYGDFGGIPGIGG